MAYRRYRRKSSKSGSLVADTARAANRLSWAGSSALGAVFFVSFYWLLPAALNHLHDYLQGNIYLPIVEPLFEKRNHWSQWLAIALGLICAFFAVRNYFGAGRLDRNGERQVGFISRLLARWID